MGEEEGGGGAFVRGLRGNSEKGRDKGGSLVPFPHARVNIVFRFVLASPVMVVEHFLSHTDQC